MAKELISRDSVPFADVNDNTFGLSIVKEVWATDRGEKTYWKYSLPNTVQLFPITTEGKIVAISEFQPGVGTDYIHLPGETMEEGEQPIKTARRGLQEEVGYEAGSLRLLTSILENSGRSDRLIHFVLALDCKKINQENEEGIQTILLEPKDFWDRLMQYLLTNPESRHGGANTLKITTLAFRELGFLQVQ